eukprot:gene13408-9225_t
MPEGISCSGREDLNEVRLLPTAYTLTPGLLPSGAVLQMVDGVMPINEAGKKDPAGSGVIENCSMEDEARCEERLHGLSVLTAELDDEGVQSPAGLAMAELSTGAHHLYMPLLHGQALVLIGGIRPFAPLTCLPGRGVALRLEDLSARDFTYHQPEDNRSAVAELGVLYHTAEVVEQHVYILGGWEVCMTSAREPEILPSCSSRRQDNASHRTHSEPAGAKNDTSHYTHAEEHSIAKSDGTAVRSNADLLSPFVLQKERTPAAMAGETPIRWAACVRRLEFGSGSPSLDFLDVQSLPIFPHTGVTTKLLSYFTPSLPPSIACHASLRIGPLLLCFGGLAVDSTLLTQAAPSDALYCFDTKTLNWFLFEGPRAVWPAARYGHALLQVPGRPHTYLMVGGAQESSTGAFPPTLVQRQDMLWLLEFAVEDGTEILTPQWRRLDVAPCVSLLRNFAQRRQWLVCSGATNGLRIILGGGSTQYRCSTVDGTAHDAHSLPAERQRLTRGFQYFAWYEMACAVATESLASRYNTFFLERLWKTSNALAHSFSTVERFLFLFSSFCVFAQITMTSMRTPLISYKGSFCNYPDRTFVFFSLFVRLESKYLAGSAILDEQAEATLAKHRSHEDLSARPRSYFLCEYQAALAAPPPATIEDLDYYAVLGLEDKREDATEREIKTAWRKLSKKHHPDIAGEEARVLYQTIQRAYEVLGDRRKRKIYDILGEDGLKNADKPQPSQEMNWMFQAFGGAPGMAGAGSNMELVLVVPLEDMYSGGGHTVTFQKTKICRACRGSGAKSQKHVHTCTHCGGKGRVLQNVQLAPGFVTRMEQECQRCAGTGKIVTMKCPVCSGKKMVRGTAKISVDIEAGMTEGHQIVYELEADQHPGQVPGDVLVLVDAPHPTFERKGLNLYTNITLTLKEALLGFAKSFPHLDGHMVHVESTGVTQHLHVEVVAEEGMPRHHVPSEKGNLLVTYIIAFPDQLSDEQKQVVRDLLTVKMNLLFERGHFPFSSFSSSSGSLSLAKKVIEAGSCNTHSDICCSLQSCFPPGAPLRISSPGKDPVICRTVEQMLSHLHTIREVDPGLVVWLDVHSKSLDIRQHAWEAIQEEEGLELPPEHAEELVDPSELDIIELVAASSMWIRGAVSCAPHGEPFRANDGSDHAAFGARSFVDGSSCTGWCSFFATRRTVVTLHEHFFAGLLEMEHHFSAASAMGTYSTASLVAKLICFTTETRIADPTTLMSEVDCMDEMVLLIAPGEQDQPDLLRRVALLRRRISADRSCLYLKEKLLHSFMAPSIRSAIMPNAHQDHMIAEEVRQSLDKITQIADRLDDARDTLNQANLNFVTGVSMRMSQSSANMDFKMQIFGQVATICLPLNLVASIFGMNCKIPFETDDYPTLTTFWVILGIMGAWCVVCMIPTVRTAIQGNRPAAIMNGDIAAECNGDGWATILEVVRSLFSPPFSANPVCKMDLRCVRQSDPYLVKHYWTYCVALSFDRSMHSFFLFSTAEIPLAIDSRSTKRTLYHRLLLRIVMHCPQIAPGRGRCAVPVAAEPRGVKLECSRGGPELRSILDFFEASGLSGRWLWHSVVDPEHSLDADGCRLPLNLQHITGYRKRSPVQLCAGVDQLQQRAELRD